MFVLDHPPGEKGFYRRFSDGQILKVQVSGALMNSRYRIVAYQLAVLADSNDAKVGDKIVVIAPGPTWNCEEFLGWNVSLDDGVAQGYVELPIDYKQREYVNPFRSSAENEAAWTQLQKNDPQGVDWKPVKFRRPETEAQAAK